MTARRSRPGLHDPATDALRAKVIAAAHGMLSEPAATAACSLDTAAARAGVARALVQVQFGTPAGLLEALLDDLTARASLALPHAFALEDPHATLAEYVAILGAFWDSERVVLRRLKGLAAFDAELASALATRDAHRRDGLRRLIARLVEAGARPARRGGLDAVDLLLALTAFETFDTLAGMERSLGDVVPAVQSLVRAALGFGDCAQERRGTVAGVSSGTPSKK